MAGGRTEAGGLTVTTLGFTAHHRYEEIPPSLYIMTRMTAGMIVGAIAQISHQHPGINELLVMIRTVQMPPMSSMKMEVK